MKDSLDKEHSDREDPLRSCGYAATTQPVSDLKCAPERVTLHQSQLDRPHPAGRNQRARRRKRNTCTDPLWDVCRCCAFELRGSEAQKIRDSVAQPGRRRGLGQPLPQRSSTGA